MAGKGSRAGATCTSVAALPRCLSVCLILSSPAEFLKWLSAVYIYDDDDDDDDDKLSSFLECSRGNAALLRPRPKGKWPECECWAPRPAFCPVVA